MIDESYRSYLGNDKGTTKLISRHIDQRLLLKDKEEQVIDRGEWTGARKMSTPSARDTNFIFPSGLLTLVQKKCKMKKKEIRFRCWVDIHGEKFFGPGPAQLLKLIEETGSISKAAKSMKMSYKKAWDMVDHLNTKGQKPYVVSHKGGQKGGGAELTPTGKKVLTAFTNLTQKIATIIEKDKDLLKLV